MVHDERRELEDGWFFIVAHNILYYGIVGTSILRIWILQGYHYTRGHELAMTSINSTSRTTLR